MAVFLLVLLAVGASWSAGSTTAPAKEDVSLATTVPLSKPRKVSDRSGPAGGVEMAIFLPGGTRTIRGAVMNPFHLDAAKQEHWREACRVWGFALIGANFFGVSNDQYAATLQAGLDDLAAKAGRPELRHMPFCFVGMSAGGGMSRGFAAAMPDRTIAVAPVCLEVAPDLEPLRAIPFLNVFGERDGGQMKLHMEKLPVQRAAGANWAIAVQWNRKHEFALANNLVVPFFEDVIRQRVPADADPSAKPVALNPATQADAWLGDVTAWAERRRAATIAPAKQYPGDPAAACWLPSARVAATWRAFVAADDAVTLSEPPGLGDKQPFILHESGKAIRVALGGNAAGVTKVDLYDGDRLLETRSAAPFVFSVKLEPGSHPLILVAHGGAEAPRSSRPHTVIVKR